jgi:AraC-like DNA-binding protein
MAERSGFKSKSIFYAVFKEEYGTTPTEWMKKHLKNEKTTFCHRMLFFFWSFWV